jgi:hypothetical protein
MPRNGSGVMQIPNTLVEGTPITAGPHNSNYADIASELTNSVAVDGQSQLSGPLKSASGTVGAPGITFGSDTDSGLYRIAGDNIGFTIGGTKLLDMASGAFSVTGTLAVSGALSAASLAITADLPITEGGTGQSTATAAFDALAPTTTRGDIVTRGASNNGRLAIGAADTLLKSDGTDLSYGKIAAANVTDGVLTHAKLASGVTASQANMEAASATDVFAPPGRQHFHPGHPKAGGNLNGSGTPAFAAGDYGMGAVTDNGVGNYVVAFDTAFADTNYWCAGYGRCTDTVGSTNTGVMSSGPDGAKTTSTFQVKGFTVGGGSAGANFDLSEIGMSFWGDYA